MHSGDTLLYRVLKARYFKNSDFVGAWRGFDPSFTWRSIWGAKALLIEGLQWRVGDGKNIRVWHDNWLPDPNGYGTPNPPANGLHDSDLLVSDIINENNSWNVTEMELYLQQEDIEKILEIPLVTPMGQDILYWKHTSNGTFSVKSAYWLGMLGRTSTNTAVVDSLWKHIWNMDGPPKIKHFLWRACSSSLAVNMELFQRHTIENGSCQCCQTYCETVHHALFFCPSSRRIWENSSFWEDIQAACVDSFATYLSRMARKLSQHDWGVFTALAWAAWTCRNKEIFEAPPDDPRCLAAGFVKYLMDYKLYSVRVHCSGGNMDIRSASCWKKPQRGIVKINVDAAVLYGKEVGLGVVARDDQGSLLFTGENGIPV
uniref:Reverse transcriptase zinc-binding domain-containing protein n=1 Tax=Chenopodium quinoa TaxID=63459 RepID=A0A803N073_CHEQI